MRAVVVNNKTTVHLAPEGNFETKCGHKATKAAPSVVHRALFCKTCFGSDNGILDWPASRLGLEQIYEVK